MSPVHLISQLVHSPVYKLVNTSGADWQQYHCADLPTLPLSHTDRLRQAVSSLHYDGNIVNRGAPRGVLCLQGSTSAATSNCQLNRVKCFISQLHSHFVGAALILCDIL